MNDDRFVDAYRRAAGEQAAARQATIATDDYVERVEEAIERFQNSVVSVTDNAKSIDFAKGDAAEMWHAGTANIDAVRQGLEPTAWAPRETVDHGPDVVFGGHERLDPAQLKYYSDAQASARAVSEPGYEDMTKIIPADQVQKAHWWLTQRAERLQDSNPVESERLQHAADTLSDHLSRHGVESLPLSESDSRGLVTDARDDGQLQLNDLGLTPDQVIELNDALRQTMEGGAEAAAVAAGIQIATYVVAAIQRAVDEGSLTSDDLLELAQGRGGAVAKSAFTGTMAGAFSLAAQSGALGDSATLIAPEAISALVVLAVNSAILTYRASIGQIGWDTAGYQIAKGSTVIAGAITGGAIGTAILPGIGTVVGSIIGGASVRIATNRSEHIAMALAVTNGWTYFGIVRQDYSVPERRLARMGWDTVDLDVGGIDGVDLDATDLEPMALDRSDLDDSVWYLRRGVIGVRTIGYV